MRVHWEQQDVMPAKPFTMDGLDVAAAVREVAGDHHAGHGYVPFTGDRIGHVSFPTLNGERMRADEFARFLNAHEAKL